MSDKKSKDIEDVFADFQNMLDETPKKDAVYSVADFSKKFKGRNLTRAIHSLVESRGFNVESSLVPDAFYLKIPDEKTIRLFSLGEPFSQYWGRKYYFKDLSRPFIIKDHRILEHMVARVYQHESSKPNEKYQILIPFFEIDLSIEFIDSDLSFEQIMTKSEFMIQDEWSSMQTQMLDNWSTHVGFLPHFNPDSPSSDSHKLGLSQQSSMGRWFSHLGNINKLIYSKMNEINPNLKIIEITSILTLDKLMGQDEVDDLLKPNR